LLYDSLQSHYNRDHYIFSVFINSIFFILSLPQESCQNYIRILTVTTPGTLLACGTNSYRPMCHYYNVTGNKYHLEKAKPGQALCPYGPKHNSTSVFVGELIFTSDYIWWENCARRKCNCDITMFQWSQNYVENFIKRAKAAWIMELIK
jgi:hypothetical protein